MSGTAVFQVNARAAGRLAARAAGGSGRIRREVMAEFRNEAPNTERTFAAFAPYDSGRTSRSVEAKQRGLSIVVSAGAVDPESGYGYLDVTRRGHFSALIPRTKRALSWSGIEHPVAFSTGTRRAEDWVVEASAAVDFEIEEMGARLGRALARVVL